MSSDSSSDKSLRTFVPLCFATFFLLASYDNGMHATSGYVYETFWEQRFPNRSDSNSTDESHCTTNKSSEAYRDGQLVQKQVARWSVYVSLAHGVPLILSSVLFSSLSDTFRRKPFLFIGAFGICIKQFLITLAMFSRWSVFLFPPFTLIEGLCGSWVTHIAISMCVISDLTSAGKSRSFYIAIFTFVSGFGSSVGIFVSGYVVTLSLMNFQWQFRLGWPWQHLFVYALFRRAFQTRRNNKRNSVVVVIVVKYCSFIQKMMMTILVLSGGSLSLLLWHLSSSSWQNLGLLPWKLTICWVPHTALPQRKLVHLRQQRVVFRNCLYLLA